jgi:hypothetical protein
MADPTAKPGAEAERIAKARKADSLKAGESELVATRRATVARLQHLKANHGSAKQHAAAVRELPAALQRLADALGVAKNDFVVFEIPRQASATAGAQPARSGRPRGTGRRQIEAREAAAAALPTSPESQVAIAGPWTAATPAPALLDVECGQTASFAALLAARLGAAAPKPEAPGTTPQVPKPASTPAPATAPAAPTTTPKISPARAALAEIEARRRAEAPASGSNATASIKAVLAERDETIKRLDGQLSAAHAEIARRDRMDAAARSGDGAGLSLADHFEVADRFLRSLMKRMTHAALQTAGFSNPGAFNALGCNIARARQEMRNCPIGSKLAPIESLSWEPPPQPAFAPELRYNDGGWRPPL